MKFPLFRRRKNPNALEAAQENQADKLLADGLRVLSQLFGRLADMVESQRLTRAGYAEPDRYLERLDQKKPNS